MKKNVMKMMVAAMVTAILCGTGTSVYAAGSTEQGLVVGEDKLHYQQNIEDELLPWHCDVSYKLDGEPIDAKLLDGVTGTLDIAIHLEENPAYEAVDLYDGEPMEVTLNIDADCLKDIDAEGAEVSEKDGKQQITYMLTPGEEVDLHITAEVTDFTAEDFTAVGIDLTEQVVKEVIREKVGFLEKIREFFRELWK